MQPGYCADCSLHGRLFGQNLKPPDLLQTIVFHLHHTWQTLLLNIFSLDTVLLCIVTSMAISVLIIMIMPCFKIWKMKIYIVGITFRMLFFFFFSGDEQKTNWQPIRINLTLKRTSIWSGRQHNYSYHSWCEWAFRHLLTCFCFYYVSHGHE